MRSSVVSRFPPVPTPSEDSRRGTSRVPLTLPGAMATGVGLALVGVGGWGFGLVELTGLGVAVLTVVAVSAVWVLARRPRFECIRAAPVGRVFAGDTVKIVADVAHRGRGRTPAVVLRDRVEHPDGDRLVVTRAVRPLAPGERARSTWRLHLGQRGSCVLGPMRLDFTDPFGVATRTMPGAGRVRFTVLPRVTPLAPPVLHHDAEFPSPTARAVPAGSEFASLREYVPGDDLRRVHWRSSARRDDLVIRHDEEPRRPGCVVVLDTGASGYGPGRFEDAVSATASIAMAAITSGQRIRVVTTAGVDSGPGDDQAHLDLILTTLAGVAPGASVRAAPVLGTDPVVLVTGEPDPTVGADRDVLRVVLTEDPTAMPADRSTLVVGPTDSFATVWDARMRTARIRW